VNLALAVLAGTGYVTLLFELPRLTYPVEAAVLGAVYVVAADRAEVQVHGPSCDAAGDGPARAGPPGGGAELFSR
jgi:hypothetical protein